MSASIFPILSWHVLGWDHNAVMGTADDMLVVFDTDCLMCSAWVHFIFRHERLPTSTFISAWSDEGLALAASHGLTAESLDRTYLVVLDGKPLIKSDATLAILDRLHAPWRWANALRFLPRTWRDWIYDRMARNRYHWFGRKDQCFWPPEGQGARFMQGPPRSTVLPDHR